MLIFLYGEDTYRSKRKLKEIVLYYQKKYPKSLSLEICDFSEENINFQELLSQFKQSPMFKEKKLIIFKNAFIDEQIKEEILKNKGTLLTSDGVIIFWEAKITENDKLVKFLKNNGRFQKFNFLKPFQAGKWAEKEIQKKGLLIDSLALTRLVNSTSGNLWRLSNEVNKLINYKKKGKISLSEVELLVDFPAEAEIFQTIDALASGQKQKALSLIQKHLEKGDSPFYLLSMISYQLRNILLAKTGALKKTGVHPYTLKKSAFLAAKLSLEQIKKAYQSIFEADFKIKTGKVFPEEEIKVLAAKIL